MRYKYIYIGMSIHTTGCTDVYLSLFYTPNMQTSLFSPPSATHLCLLTLFYTILSKTICSSLHWYRVGNHPATQCINADVPVHGTLTLKIGYYANIICATDELTIIYNQKCFKISTPEKEIGTYLCLQVTLLKIFPSLLRVSFTERTEMAFVDPLLRQQTHHRV